MHIASVVALFSRPSLHLRRSGAPLAGLAPLYDFEGDGRASALENWERIDDVISKAAPSKRLPGPTLLTGPVLERAFGQWEACLHLASSVRAIARSSKGACDQKAVGSVGSA